MGVQRHHAVGPGGPAGGGAWGQEIPGLTPRTLVCPAQMDSAGACRGQGVKSVANGKGWETQKLALGALLKFCCSPLPLTQARSPARADQVLHHPTLALAWLLKNVITGKFFLVSLLLPAVVSLSFLPVLVRGERASRYPRFDSLKCTGGWTGFHFTFSKRT